MNNFDKEVIESGHFLEAFKLESDRGAAIIAAAYLEEILKQILDAYLADVKCSDEILSGFNAPFGSFSAKIKTTYSLGFLEDKEFSTINTIRQIRNKFAHSWKGVSFQSQSIIDLCKKLSNCGHETLDKATYSRDRFNMNVAILYIDLLFRIETIRKNKREIITWASRL